ncbi:hypothetical protein H0H92_007354 [Tricholoma furcatifolium]|nr:hypothetical protein H0H92_007354 [Tricholoma furcatifolium]
MTPPTHELIFVTGASGFLGSHIVLQLLQKGYRVRAAAREHRIADLMESHKKFGDRFHAVAISDIAVDQFPDALKDVDAVIHTAASLPERQGSAEMLSSAIDGTLNVIRQAEKAGIKRLVVTSSIVTVINPSRSFTDKDWYPITKEEALNTSGMDTYRAAKTLAEKELWAFGEAHPHLDITTLNPPYLYGPLAETFTVPVGSYTALSTDLYIYRFLSPDGGFMPSAGQADVRDIAHAHVLALTSPPTSAVGRKRILIASPHGFHPKAVLEMLAESRPELQSRLTKNTSPEYPFDRTPIDFGRVEEVLGMSKDDFKGVEETMIETVDSLIALEKQWVAQGHEIHIPQM